MRLTLMQKAAKATDTEWRETLIGAANKHPLKPHLWYWRGVWHVVPVKPDRSPVMNVLTGNRNVAAWNWIKGVRP